MVSVVTHSAQGSRLNRRGQASRQNILEVAVQCLGNGGSEAVSANLIAKKAGVTWGTIQHQFGDSDGVWAAVLEYVRASVAEELPTAPNRTGSVAQRLSAIVDTLWRGLDTANSRAVQNLRSSLPRDQAVLAREYPATYHALRHFDETWTALFDELLGGVVSSRVKRQRVRSLLPSALRGIYTQSHLSTNSDAEEAKRGLIDALVAYLSG